MPIEFSCMCGRKLRVKDEHAGRKFKCPGCGAATQAPAPKAADDLLSDDLLTAAESLPAIASPNRQSAERRRSASSAKPDVIVRRIGGLLGILADRNKTVASRPGQMRVDPLKHMLCYQGEWALYALMMIGFLIVGFYFAEQGDDKKSISAFVAVGVAAYLLYFHYVGVRVRFVYGDINPGVIVKKNLVAVLTNLGIDGREYYALKILAQPVRNMTGGTGEPGERVAAACQYSGHLSGSHWRDFDFELVQCATRNEATVERVMRTIPEEEWQALKDAVANVEGRLWSGRLIPLEVR